MNPQDNTPPLVSVIIPNYNTREYIEDFLESLLKTNYSAFEVIIVDDGSNDGSKEYLAEIEKRDSRIKVINTLKKRGLTNSRNRAIEITKGKYIALAETDMKFDPQWMSEAIKVLEGDSTIGGVSGKVRDIDHPDLLQAVGLRLIPQIGWVSAVGFAEKDSDYSAKEQEVTMGAVGTFVRKSVMQKLRGFDEEMDRIDDIDLGWRIWVSGSRIVSVPSSITYHVTIKPWNIRKKSVTKIQQEMASIRVLRMIIKNYELKNVLIYLPQGLFLLIARAIVNLTNGNIYPLVSLPIACLWLITTLPSTLHERKYMQSIRGFSDERLFQSIMVKGNLLHIFRTCYKDTSEKLNRFK